MALAGKVRLFISDAIMDEMLEVLEMKFEHSPRRLAEATEAESTGGIRRYDRVQCFPAQFRKVLRRYGKRHTKFAASSVLPEPLYFPSCG